jgi:hypothetical protein
MPISDCNDGRKRLSNRHGAVTFDLIADGQRYYATVGHFDDGRLAEIFISNSKSGSQNLAPQSTSGLRTTRTCSSACCGG